MAEKFNLSEFVNRSINESEDNSASAPTQSNISSLHLLYIRYKRKVWIAFYSILTASIVTSAVFIEKTNIATSIMDRVRQNQGIGQIQIPESIDLSSLSITTSPGMTALITTPDDKRVGEDAENVRFYEAPLVSMTQQSSENSSWSVNLKKPINGEYQVDLFVQDPGEYTMTFESLDKSGKNSADYQFKLNLNQNQIVRYLLFFDKDNYLNTKFISTQTIIR